MPWWPRIKHSGDLMHSGKLIFAQLMEHLPEQTLVRCVARYRGNHKIQSVVGQDQFLCRVFAPLTFRESLCDIEACLCSQTEKLCHMGIRGQVSRNTLVSANALQRAARIYADLAQHLIGIARCVPGKAKRERVAAESRNYQVKSYI